jgi:hypothetical protein
MKRHLLTLMLILGILVTTAFTQQPAKPVQWEYKLEYKINEKRLNALSAEGWEVVTASTDNAGTMMVGYLILRRPKS